MKEFDGVRLVELAEARFDMLEGGDALRGDEDKSYETQILTVVML